MTTAVAENKKSAVQKSPDNLPALSGPRLPFHPAVEERFGIDRASWKALVESIFPNASSADSVILALSYCRARKLDVFKRPVHIVAIYDSKRECMVDTVWPGIGELRTTAFRTGEYAGRASTVLGPDITMKVGRVDMQFPEWAQVTVYRMVKGQKVEFAGPRVYWLETYASVSRKDDSPNMMWANRPRGQLEKCAEAAALRAAFPEEIGSDYIPEEVENVWRKEIVESTAVSVSKAESLIQRLSTADAALDDAPYNPDAMKSSSEEAQTSESKSEEPREAFQEPEHIRLSDLALAIEAALHEPDLMPAANLAQKQQIIEALGEGKLTTAEATHLQRIVSENAARLSGKK